MVGCGGPAKATVGGASGATVTFQAPSSRPRASWATRRPLPAELQLGLGAAGAEVGEVGPGLAQAEPRAGDAALLLDGGAAPAPRCRPARCSARLLARLLGRRAAAGGYSRAASPRGRAAPSAPRPSPGRRRRRRSPAASRTRRGRRPARHQEQQDRRPQRPGVAGRQVGARRAEAQARQARHQPLAVQGPQALRERVLDALPAGCRRARAAAGASPRCRARGGRGRSPGR